VLAVNVVGCFTAARQAIKRMSTRHGGRGGAIVNISSAAARPRRPREVVHHATPEGAIHPLTPRPAPQIPHQGNRLDAVRPGMIDTEIHASSGAPERVARIIPTVPMKRIGTAEEVAQSILWLLSDDASYVTGAIVDVAGGR